MKHKRENPIFRWTRCGETYYEVWHGTGSCDFTVQDENGHEKAMVGCEKHPTHPGSRGPHLLEQIG